MTTISCTRAIPVLRIFDEAMTKEFYVDFLEFEITFEHRFEPALPLYMGVKKGTCELHLSGHFGDASPHGGVRIETTGLDEYAELLRGKQYKHARPGAPQDQEWGCKELTIQDPSGNKLTFFTNLPRA
jgi:Glyoxalase superfamily protein